MFQTELKIHLTQTDAKFLLFHQKILLFQALTYHFSIPRHIRQKILLMVRLTVCSQQERLLIGIMSCANCEWQLEETRDYLRNRKAFGKTLSNLQVSHPMHFSYFLYTAECIGCTHMHLIQELSGVQSLPSFATLHFSVENVVFINALILHNLEYLYIYGWCRLLLVLFFSTYNLHKFIAYIYL